jgi:hypothetical protein
VKFRNLHGFSQLREAVKMGRLDRGDGTYRIHGRIRHVTHVEIDVSAK